MALSHPHSLGCRRGATTHRCQGSMSTHGPLDKKDQETDTGAGGDLGAGAAVDVPNPSARLELGLCYTYGKITSCIQTITDEGKFF